MTVSEHLNKFGITYATVQRPKGRQAVFPCPVCGDKNFSMSLDDGAFSCVRQNKCGVKGAWADFLRLIGQSYKPLNMQSFIHHEKKVYSKPVTKPEPVNNELYDFFKKRGISAETVKYFKIGKKEDYILFPYHKAGELVNIKHRGINEKKFIREKGCISTLFNQDNIETNYLIICEGEIDAMSLLEYGLNGVSVPSGVNDLSWIENDFEYLERFDTIYICLDSDTAGQSAVDTIAVRLGKWRCKNIVLPHKDINECLVNGITPERMQEIIFDESNDFKINELKTISDYEADIKSRNENPELLNGKKTSFSKFTQILKGWRKKELTVWSGQNGAGKTTILTQELLNLSTEHNEKICIGSFEMPPAVYLSWMLKQHLEKENLASADIEEAIGKLKNNIFIIDIEDNIDRQKLFDIMEFASRKYGINHYCIDSLMKINLSSSEAKIYGEQKNFVSDLKNFSKKYDTHIHLVAHPRKSSHDSDVPGKVDVAGSADITNLADNVIVMHRLTEEQRAEIQGNGGTVYDTFLKVKKNREHGTCGSVGLFFIPEYKKFESRDYEDKPRTYAHIDKSDIWHGGNE